MNPNWKKSWFLVIPSPILQCCFPRLDGSHARSVKITTSATTRKQQIEVLPGMAFFLRERVQTGAPKKNERKKRSNNSEIIILVRKLKVLGTVYHDFHDYQCPVLSELEVLILLLLFRRSFCIFHFAELRARPPSLLPFCLALVLGGWEEGPCEMMDGFTNHYDSYRGRATTCARCSMTRFLDNATPTK
jgi:hypothetical protein